MWLRRLRVWTSLFVVGGLVLCGCVSAHVPYLELKDFSEDKPFKVRNSIEQSIAVYSWLMDNGSSPSTDIDVYEFEISDESMLVYIEVIVPVCGGYYADFVPWFALVGPGLPLPNQSLPFEIPLGYGAVVRENVIPGEPRDTFYEFFGGKWYYEGPVFEEEMGFPGTYYVYYWDPYQIGGDYVAVLGRTEQFGFRDIIRSLLVTPFIRLDFELHCPK